MLSSDDYFVSGPYGSMNGGEWFTDFWQSLDGKDYNPKHWPDGITLRYGERIDSIQVSQEWNSPNSMCRKIYR